MNKTDAVDLITDRLAEVIGLDIMVKIVESRQLKIYWGTAPTGRIHIGYLVPLLKIADFLRAGCIVKILFADLHAMMDNLKSNPKVIEQRTVYYEQMIRSMLTNLGVDLANLQFVRGSSFQQTPAYVADMYKATTLTSVHDAKKASSEVVKQIDNPKMSGLIYPIMQALDEQYMDVDAQFGGLDQRRIFTYASDILPAIGYKKRIHLMNPMLTAINSMPNSSAIKMSSSDTVSKIDMLDSKNEIRKKINRAYCLEGDVEFNPLMDLMRLVIFPLLANKQIASFQINRGQKFGGPVEYANYEALVLDFVGKKLHPGDLKSGIADCLENFIEPIRRQFENKQMQQMIRSAYA